MVPQGLLNQGLLYGKSNKIRKIIVMNKNDIIYNINRLESRYSAYKSKCLRNMRLFTYSSTTTLDISESEVVGYFHRGTFSTSDDTTSAIQENVIASCIETLCTKIASQKVRPFFNTVNGTFKEIGRAHV